MRRSRGASLAALLAVLVSAPARAAQEVDWPGVWDRVAALDPTDDAGRAELRELASGDAVRPRLLAALLTPGPEADARLGASLAEADAWPLSPRESLLAVQHLPPGPLRVRASVYGLENLARELSQDEVLAVWRAAIQEAEALRLQDGALPIQELLHERYHSTWTAIDLALTLSRLGRPETDEVLEAQIRREREAGGATGDLWARRGIAALGMGNEEAGRDYLGRAWAQGATDGAVLLARLELDHGRRLSARRIFGALSRLPEPSPWALRGYGLACLPEVRVPARRTSAPEMTPDGI